VHDNYTNQDHQVYGLCGVFAVRGGQHLAVHDNEYCCQNSTSDLAGRGKCQANMTPGFLNLAYVAVTECDDPNDSTCGRPLMTLAVPALPGGAPNTACKPPVPPSIACKAVTGAPPTLVASLLPSSHAVQVGVPATFFATIINAGTSEASQVGIALASIQSQALLTFNATACASNAVIGGDNVRVNIAAGDRACFVVRLTAIGALGPTEVSFTFAGTNTTPAPTLPGVNTLMLVASTTPAPDLVALVVTATGDGILTLAGPAGSGAFSVATANVGASALITATANTHGLNLPLTVLICESDPVTAACKATPAGSVTAQANGGQTLTFSVFALAEGPVAFDPAVNRIFVEWSLGGVLVGRTSVAVRTL
jgi:hypothetical protein